MSKSRGLKKLHYAYLLMRRGGIGVLLRLLFSRVYSTAHYVWLAKDLDPEKNSGTSRATFSLEPASAEAFGKISARLSEEKGQDLYEILRRISFYERGFNTCYFFSTDSGDICHITWLLTASHNPLIRSQYPAGTDELEEGEALVENSFTFPRYRGKGIMVSVLRQMEDLARKQGFRRMVAYVEVKNTASLKGVEKAGYYSFGEEKEKRRFFRTRRTGRSDR